MPSARDLFFNMPSLIQKLRFSPFVAQLVVTRRCNLACAYCSEHEPLGEPVSARVLEKRMERLKALGTRIITLTGGEPTLHPDLCELIRYGRRLGFFRVSMISNALNFTPSLVRELDAAGLQELQVSIDGVSRNQITRKVLDHLQKPMEILRANSRFNVTVNAVAGACPPHELKTILCWSKQMGFAARVGLMHEALGQLSLSPEALFRHADILSLLPRTFRDFSGYRGRLARNGAAPFKCRAGSRFIYVDETGRVSMCSQTRQHWSMPLERLSMRHLKERFYASKPCQDRCTLGCVRSCSQFENWRRQDGKAAF